MLLVIDNYDSFTYNLVQYLGELGAEMKIVRNDEVTADEIENDLRPEKILISPGPGTPDDAGISLEVIKRFSDRIPILGVCLGHQAIGQHFGGKVVRAPEPVHGKPVEVRHDGIDSRLSRDFRRVARRSRYGDASPIVAHRRRAISS